jgi:uncharacterized protein YbjT (DUF2867 family)
MPKQGNKKMVLVTGATGKQGGATLRHLRQRGIEVRALTRNPDSPEARRLVGRGTEVVHGDLDDQASLTRALDGVWGAYAVQASRQEGGAEAEVRQGVGFADAAKRSRISHLVYSSVGSADRNTGIPHFDSKARIEEHIRGTGLRYTIFRPVFFMENWMSMRAGIEQGTLHTPLRPDTRLQMIAVDDIGAFAAMAFEHPGHWQDRTLELAGDDLSMAEIAKAFTLVLGREVRYEQVPWERFEQQAGGEMTVMWKWFEEVGYRLDISAVRQEYPSLMALDKWLHANWKTAPGERALSGAGGGSGQA